MSCVHLSLLESYRGAFRNSFSHMSYSLNSLKGGSIVDCIGEYYRGAEGGY